MKKQAIVTGLIIFLCILCVPAMAATNTLQELWVSADGEKGVDAIKWYKPENGKEYYLFLPGNADIASLKIGFTGTDSLTCDNETILCGDSAAVFKPGETAVITVGKKKYTLHIMQGSPNLPSVYITTATGKLTKVHASKENKESGNIIFVNAEGNVEYEGGMTYIRMRGNSSTTFKKKNYQIKLENGANLCGMGKCRTWVLTGNSRDKSLIRNQMTLDMAMYAGLAYTPEHVQAELYINNEYMGLYLFGEKNMIDDDRIAIADLEEATEKINDKELSAYKLVGTKAVQPGKYKAYDIENDPEDITGGYLVEFEAYSSRYKQAASAYYTLKKNTLVIKSPEYCSVAQMEYITTLMQTFENAIFAADGNDPKTGKHYSDVVDMDSLVNKYLIEEISKNYDGNFSSMFFYKDVDSVSTKAYAGPVWDYDSAYASYAREDNAKKVLTGKLLWIGDATGAAYWWPALYKKADFKEAMIARYQECFLPAIAILLGEEKDETGVLHSIDEYAQMIRASAEMNFTRWPIVRNSTSTVARTGDTFDENLTYLKDFLTVRRTFLNETWLGGAK